MEKEIWKDAGVYGIEVSTLGRVRRKNDGYMYSVHPNRAGYNCVSMWDDKTVVLRVARLVAKIFIPNPQNKPQVDHINTIRNDDRVENLRWVTRSENMHNPITLQRLSDIRLGKKNPSKEIPILQYTKDGIFVKEWPSATAFGEYLGKNVCGNIINCIKGKMPSAYGYKWKYKNT